MKNQNIYRLISAQLLLASSAVHAQEDVQQADSSAAVADTSTEESGLTEITVVAQRRSENLQRVPIVVSVATSAELAQSGVNGVQELKILTPGLEVQSNTGYASPIIRGVGSKGTIAGFEPPIATYVDGVYYAAATASIFQFNNIAQVEVLKGPQGTLFGRNATGGLIHIITKDPQRTFGGEVELGYGNYDTKSGSIYLTGGLTESLSADIAVQGSAQGNGWGTNFFNGQDVYKNHHDVSVRSKWLWQAGDNTEIRATFDYADQKNSLGTQRTPIGVAPLPSLGLPYGGSPWDTNVNVQPILTLKTGGINLKIDHDFDTVSLTSITAYRRSKFFTAVDADYTATNFLAFTLRQTDWQFSQEFQILSNSTSSPFSWVLGAYYFLASGEYSPFNLTNAGTPIRTVYNETKTDSISGFGQATLAVTDALKITGGLRYTSEERSLDFPSTPGLNLPLTPLVNRSRRFNKLTWRASIDYTFTDDLFGYASYNRGFKSGGYNSINPFLPVLEYGPETLDAFEVGFKSTFLDHRVRFNASGFYYNYDKVQVQSLQFGGNAIYNGPTAKIHGFDVDIQAKLTSQLSFDIGYQYLHGRYGAFPGLIQGTRLSTGGFQVTPIALAPSGKAVIFTPESTVSARANYKAPIADGAIDFNIAYYYNSGFFQEPDNLLRQEAYTTLNLSAKWSAPDEHFSVGLWMNNATNAAVANINGIQPFGATGGERISYAAPRTFGITVGSKF